jgi:hypothetical protein
MPIRKEHVYTKILRIMRPDHFEIDTIPTGTITTKGYWKDTVYRDSIFTEGVAWKISITPVGNRDFSASIWRLDGDGHVEHSEATVIKAIYGRHRYPRRD